MLPTTTYVLMSDAEQHPSNWIRTADHQILAFLEDRRTDYPALIASRLGIHTPYVERRCAVLAERGMLEAVTEEVVYRITERGVDYLQTQPETPHP